MELFSLFATLGLKDNGFNSGMDAAEKKGSGLASKLGGVAKGIGSAFATAGKVAATGLAVGTAAFAGLTTKALEAGANLEQSVGGIETLFKDSADTVIANSKKAYETAGIDAVSYMDQVTSFSASLLQSLDGDTVKAAAAADQAIIDMSDNANKMGTDISSIQTAYQGFAKQNYTMLDNLKLGYGGTKEEMQRLLVDAEKLTGVKYDISNLNDVYEAIHVIQGELGITGTTALEAAETLSGAFTAAKGALENFISGAGDVSSVIDTFSNLSNIVVDRLQELLPRLTEGVTQLVQGLAPQIAPILQELLPALVEGAEALFSGLMESMPVLLEALSSVIPMIVEAFAVLFPQVIQIGMDILMALIDGVTQALPSLIPAAMEAITTIITGFTENIGMITEAAIGIITALVEGLTQALPQIIPAATEAILSFVQAIVDNLPELISAGLDLLLALVDGILEAIPKIIEAGPQIIEGLINGIVESLPKLIETASELIIKFATYIIENLPEIIKSGIEIIGSIIKGLVEAIPKLLEAGKDLAKKLWDKIKETDWLQLGKDVLLAIINGIGNIIGNLRAKATEVVSNLWNTIKETDWLQLGKDILNFIIDGIVNIQLNLFNKGKELAQNLKDAFFNNPWVQLGGDIIDGIVNGVKNAASNLVNTVKNVASNALNGIKNLLGIHSPSRVFRDEVGKQIPAGIALGVTDNSKLVTNALSKVKKDSLSSVEDWLTEQRKKIDISAREEANVWLAVSKTYAEGTQLRKDAEGKAYESTIKWISDLKNAREISTAQEIALMEQAAEQFASNASIRTQIEEDMFKATQTWLKERQELTNVSAMEEIAIWGEVRASYEENAAIRSQIDQSQINALKNYVEEENLTSIQQMRLWENAAALYEEGSKVKIQAEENFLAARKKIEEEIETLEENYQKAYEQRVSQLKSAFGLFDEATSETVNGSDLTQNLQNQNTIISQWMNDMAALTQRGLDEGLLAELQSAGIKAADEVHAIATMSEPELANYVNLWQTKMKLINEQATKDLESLRKETDDKIKALVDGSDELLDVMVVSFEEAGENSVDGMINGIKNKEGALYEAITGLTKKSIQTLNDGLDIHSPSRLTFKIGEFFDLGIVGGIKHLAGKVTGAVTDLYENVENLAPEPRELFDQNAIKVDASSSNDPYRSSGTPMIQMTNTYHIYNDVDYELYNKKLTNSLEEQLRNRGIR